MRVRRFENSSAQSAVFLLVLILAYVLRDPGLLAVLLSMAGLIIATNVRSLSLMRGRNKLAVISILIILTASLPISVLRDEAAVAHYAIVVCTLLAGYIATRNAEVYVFASKVALVACQTYIVAYILRTGVLGFPLENIIPNSSSNGVTSYLVLLQVNYSFANHIIVKKGSIVTALVTLGICIVGYGRGSILASGLIVVANLCRSLLAGSKPAVVLKVMTLVPLLSFLLIAIAAPVAQAVFSNTKLANGFVDPHRSKMIAEYSDKLDALSLFIGADYGGTSIESDYNGNPHNSYIRAHHIFGLAYLIAMLALPMLFIFAKRGLSAGPFVLILGAAAMFRAFTEPILFPGLLDFFYFACCFVAIDSVEAAA